MKELTVIQLEDTTGGVNWSCVGQVTTGIELLASAAAIGIFAITPLGWGCLALTALSFVASVIADPTACDE